MSTERDKYYQLALNRFRDKSDVIPLSTCDGRRGLLKDLLNILPNSNVPFKHKWLKGAYASPKYYEKYLFTFEKYPELNIEKTSNRLEGLFSELK